MSGLEARVGDHVMACIGCNDCLLACPIPQSRLVTIGELNAAVHLPVVEAPNVVEFVAACTQCRQCVPVCPADIDRADMVLFNKMKVEDTLPDREIALQARSVSMGSGWTLDGLSAELTNLALFAGVGSRDLRRLLLGSTLRLHFPGDRVCDRGDFLERLCIVLAGALEQSSVGFDGRRVPILNLGPGSFFGELGVLTDAAEPYDVTALEQSIVLEVPKATVLRLGSLAPEFQRTLDSLYRQRALWSYATQKSALGALPEAAARELLESADLRPVKAGEFLFREGQPSPAAYLVRSGFLRAVKGGSAGLRVLVYFREGDLFGHGALLQGQPQPFAVQAASRAEVIAIPAAALHSVVARHRDAQDALVANALASEALARSVEVGLAPIATEGADTLGPTGMDMSLHSLVREGIATGREVLVVDQTRCTNCQNCIAACERRHGHARLELRGQQMGDYLFPTACRHCDDPTCLLCSVNGIVRLPSGQIRIVEESCIGCGACAERCPYGNISMHPIERRKRGFVFTLMDLLVGSRRRDEALEELDPKVRRVAVKCDLCAGYDDYACVTACPVGAAFRIDPTTGTGARKRP